MINYLIGKPLLQQNQLTLLVNNVGYGVRVTEQTLATACNKEIVELHIYTHVREEALELFGFETFEQKSLFLMVLEVSGVGPSTALAIISKDSRLLVKAVQEADVSFFQNIPRVGKKLAQKIIIDLKAKLGSITELDLKPLNSKQTDIVEALLALGYDEHKAHQAVKELDIEAISVQEAIKHIMRTVTL